MCFFHAPHLCCQRKETKARIGFWEHSLQDIKYEELEKAHDFIFFPFLRYFLSSSANNWERKPSEDIEATSRDRLRSAWNYWDQPYCSNHFFVKKNNWGRSRRSETKRALWASPSPCVSYPLKLSPDWRQDSFPLVTPEELGRKRFFQKHAQIIHFSVCLRTR